MVNFSVENCFSFPFPLRKWKVNQEVNLHQEIKEHLSSWNKDYFYVFNELTQACFVHLHQLPDLEPRWWPRCLSNLDVRDFWMCGHSNIKWEWKRSSDPCPSSWSPTFSSGQASDLVLIYPVGCRFDLEKIRETNSTHYDPSSASQETAIPPALGCVPYA